MRELWRVICHYGGRSISIASAILGILYWWPNIRGLPNEYGYTWGQFIPNREIAALIALSFTMVWIIWMDIRPAIRDFISRQNERFLINDRIYCESRLINKLTPESPRIYQNKFFLVVSNNNRDGESLRRVQARVISVVPPPMVLRIKDAADEMTDIRHGEYALFELGEFFGEECLGVPCGTNMPQLTPDWVKHYEYAVPRNILTYHIYSPIAGSGPLNIGYVPDNHQEPFVSYLIISADDVKSKETRLTIDLSKANSTPVTIEAI